MSIKIIKDGVKVFKMTCPYCGCEFAYQNEDVCNSEVICPCCSTNLPHEDVIETVNPNPFPTDEYNDLGYHPFTVFDAEWATKSDIWSGTCEGCPHNPKNLKTPYIGDSPCLWCQKSPYKVTCISEGK